MAKMEHSLEESSEEIREIMSVYEKSEDINAFVEDMKTRSATSADDVKKYIENTIESF